MAIIVCGIDPSTSTGLTFLTSHPQDDHAFVRKITFPKETGFRRLKLIAQSVRSALEEGQPDHVFIEGYNYRNKFTLVCMVEVGTVIRQVLYDMDMPYTEVPPTQLKRFTTGNGNAKKPDMAKAVKEKWGFEHKSHDIIDSYALAQLGAAVMRGEFDLTEKAPRKKRPKKESQP